MDWPLTTYDAPAVTAWCLLNGAMGKWLLGLIGGAGIIASIKSIWNLPVSNSDIITVRNKQNRYRRWTIVLGWVTIALLLISAGAYVIAEYYMGLGAKVCETRVTAPGVANILLPFFGICLVAIVFFAWLQAGVLKLK